MCTSIRSVLIILVIALTAMWVIKKQVTYQEIQVLENRFGVSFTLVVTEDHELHKLYGRSALLLGSQKVGIKQVDDPIWQVSFMEYGLGYFDMDSCRIEPGPNPFGPKLLTM